MVILAGEFLKEAKPFVEEGVHPRVGGGGEGVGRPVCSTSRMQEGFGGPSPTLDRL